MSAKRRTPRDERRRSLGQNFLRPEFADELVAEAGVLPGELVVDIGAGSGAITLALARTGAEVLAVERDPVWAARLRERVARERVGRVRVVTADVRSLRLPPRPFRVMSSVPFGVTTEVLRLLLDDPGSPLERADLIVQFEVARKRSEAPPSTLLSASWAPWWELRLLRRIPAAAFRPVPRVDAGVLVVTRRDPPVLPVQMARRYREFVRGAWPFDRV